MVEPYGSGLRKNAENISDSQAMNKFLNSFFLYTCANA